MTQFSHLKAIFLSTFPMCTVGTILMHAAFLGIRHPIVFGDVQQVSIQCWANEFCHSRVEHKDSIQRITATAHKQAIAGPIVRNVVVEYLPENIFETKSATATIVYKHIETRSLSWPSIAACSGDPSETYQ